MAYPISLNTLKAKINIAKAQLGIDEDVYRAILNDATGKISLKEMNLADLMMVLHAMEQRGFKAMKPTNKKSKRYSKASGQTSFSRTPQDKIVAIWITMQRHIFVKDGSETALDKFINNQTRNMGKFAVTSLRFLSPQQASHIIEVLKKWHIREMTKALKQTDSLGKLPNNGVMPYLDLIDAYDAINRELENEKQAEEVQIQAELAQSRGLQQ